MTVVPTPPPTPVEGRLCRCVPVIAPLWLVRFGYWLRPFDMHLDRRRWRYSTPGCVRSRRALLRAIGRESSR